MAISFVLPLLHYRFSPYSPISFELATCSELKAAFDYKIAFIMLKSQPTLCSPQTRSLIPHYQIAKGYLFS